MVEVPAPASFPQVFGGTLVWMESRAGFPESEFISGHPLIKMMLEWLLKVYGTLRWDDLQRLRPDQLELRSYGLVGRLVRTKTLGVGRRVRELPLFVPVEADLSGTGWLKTGFDLLPSIGTSDRDFFLARPLPDYSGF